MKKLKEIAEKVIPTFWAICWVIIITAGSLIGAIALVKMLLRALGVM